MKTTTATICGDCGAYIPPSQQGNECPVCGAKPIQEGRKKMKEARNSHPRFAPTAMLPVPYSYARNQLLLSWDIFFTPRHPDEESVYFAGGLCLEADAKKVVALLNSCGYVPKEVRS